MSGKTTHRRTAPPVGGLALTAAVALGAAVPGVATAQEDVAPITIVINQSPWFSFHSGRVRSSRCLFRQVSRWCPSTPQTR